MNGKVIFCDFCHNEALRTAPMIVEVPSDHHKYTSGQSIERNLESPDEGTDA